MGTSLFQSEPKPVFARHETFHPRYGWLKKAFDKVNHNNDSFFFNSDQASVVLGVGKNMVKSIKYWSLAFKILYDEKLPSNSGYAQHRSDFGKKLLSDNGWDPYLEDLASLWLLHWNLLKVPGHATAWHYAFNIFNKHVFSVEELLTAMIGYKVREFPALKISESSFQKDINCILRMYVEQTSKKVAREDSIDCPFSEIGLIKNYGDAKHYSFVFGPKPGLVPEIIVAACLEYAALETQGAGTVSAARLLYDSGSPGLSFKLTESQLCDAIEQLTNIYTEISLSESAGLLQLSFSDKPAELADSILNGYYNYRK